MYICDQVAPMRCPPLARREFFCGSARLGLQQFSNCSKCGLIGVFRWQNDSADDDSGRCLTFAAIEFDILQSFQQLVIDLS